MSDKHVLCYTREPQEDILYAKKLAYSMHLAYSEDGSDYEALNHNSGIALITEDKLFLTFSSAAVDATYVVGILTAEPGADLLNTENWTKGESFTIEVAVHGARLYKLQ